MRTAILTFLAFATVFAASGQGLAGAKLASGHQSANDHQAVINVLQHQMAQSTAAKTTQIKKRLSGYSYVWNGVLNDTSHYYYSGLRGFHHQSIYDFFDYYQAQSSIFALGGQFITQQAIQSDSSVSWERNTDGDLELIHKKVYGYNSNDKVVSCLDSSTAWYYVKNELEYDIMGRLASFISYDTFGGTQLIPKSNTFVKYSSTGKREMDSSVILPAYQPAYKSSYTYDNNGNFITFVNSVLQIGNVWDPQGQNIYVYDNNNRLVSFTSQYYFLGDLYSSWKDSFSYTGSNTQFSVYLNYVYNLQTDHWTPTSKEYDHVNAQGLVDSYYLFTWNVDDFDTLEKNYIVYDNENLALYSHAFNYTGFGNFATTPYDKQTWYYEEYDDPTGTGVIESTVRFDIYPNPAGDKINIRAGDPDAAQAVLISSSGSALSTGKFDREGRLTVDLNIYPPGIYFVVFKDKNGKSLYKTSFIHQ